MANIGMTTFSLLCVVHLYCVLGRQNTEILFTLEKSGTHNATVNLGSNVTFSCRNSWSDRTNWSKIPSSGNAAAFVDKREDGCVLHNEKYPSISQGRCSDDYIGITFNSIQYTDSGRWWCTIDVNGIVRTSQYVNVEVKENVERTTRVQVPTSQTTELLPTKPTTTPRVNTKRPGTTGTWQPPIQTTTPGIASTMGTSGEATSTVTSKAPTSSSKQTVTIGRPGFIGMRTTDEEDTPSYRSYLIPVVAGVCGVTVLIVVVVIIVILKLRARKYSQTGGGRQHNDRNDEDGDEQDQGYRNPEDTNQAQINAPGGGYSSLHSDPQIDSHVYTDVTEGARGQVVRKEGNYSTLHSDCQEYTHMYGVIDGRVQEGFQAQMTPQVDYYNCGPQEKEDVHLYTNVDDGGYETCQTTL